MRQLYSKIIYISTLLAYIYSLNIVFFFDILIKKSNSICLFDLSTVEFPEDSFYKVKIIYLLVLFISSLFLSITIQTKFSKYFKKHDEIVNLNNPNELCLHVGTCLDSGEEVIIPEKGLYQNILITGTIGTGKTSSAMYPFLDELLNQNLGMLILDVKGNFHRQVTSLNEKYHRNVIVIELNGKYKYNPLHKPNLKPSIIANRLRTILSLFSNTNVSDTFWLDKVEIFLSEAIKLCRLYNNGYVTFIELHKLVSMPTYLEDKISIVKDLFLKNKLSSKEIYDFNTLIDFFQNEYKTLDQKVLSIIQSEITRITQIFISDIDVSNTFCPPLNELNFKGFSLNSNDVVVLNMNVAEYRNLSKIIAAYLKLDFQSEVLMRLSNSSDFPPLAFLCDEYHEYATENDADFYAQSREAKCISIVSTQSYSSLLKTIKDQSSAKVLIQNLVNKIWFRTDDNYTIEEAQKQLGKEDKTKFIKSISENAKETKYNYLLRSFKSDNSNISESISSQVFHDFIYDFNSFSRDLKTFQAICFLSTGSSIMPPKFIQLKPYYLKNSLNSSQAIQGKKHSHKLI